MYNIYIYVHIYIYTYETCVQTLQDGGPKQFQTLQDILLQEQMEVFTQHCLHVMFGCWKIGKQTGNKLCVFFLPIDQLRCLKRQAFHKAKHSMKAKMLMQMYCVGPMMKEPRKRRQKQRGIPPCSRDLLSLQGAILEVNTAAISLITITIAA